MAGPALSEGVYRAVVGAARPILGIGFPGRGAIFRRLITNPDYNEYWKDAELHWVRGSVHGYELPCDLSIFTGRLAYFLKRWNEADTQSVLLTLLRPGDTFVDIGANVGMATLTAARAIGPAGSIVAYEPNPEVAAILKEAVHRNGLEMVEVHVSAIGPEAGHAPLFVPESNHGEASLGSESAGQQGRKFDIAIENGSRLASLDRCDFIKIDVEGFEVHVIDAIAKTIEAHRPMVSTEVIERHLNRCGSGTEQLAQRFNRLGYAGFIYSHESVGLTRFQARLEPFTFDGPTRDMNVLWVPSERADAVRQTKFASIRR